MTEQSNNEIARDALTATFPDAGALTPAQIEALVNGQPVAIPNLAAGAAMDLQPIVDILTVWGPIAANLVGIAKNLFDIWKEKRGDKPTPTTVVQVYVKQNKPIPIGGSDKAHEIAGEALATLNS